MNRIRAASSAAAPCPVSRKTTQTAPTPRPGAAKEQFGSPPRESDTVNAPWTGDLGGTHLTDLMTLLDEILGRARSGHTDLARAIEDLKGHLRTLPLHPTATARLQQQAPPGSANRLHYQGVNLENAGEDVPAEERRVEFRDLAAQSSYQELMSDLGYINRRLLDVRSEVLGAQNSRLAARHGA
ncbi:hypothetical protein [Streptomyces sp. SP18CM02]|uniref:hypothetical protein n=1 Tax=Streptomyces sp. SP18CM02 TaxID=2758571 RepID=UPI00168AA4D5|nr:hypothetical protein [Streptomyces sp. SP18CM02]MBD3555930.1 hypothetical protein [Streptomyces sp. SP18CM02]